MLGGGAGALVGAAGANPLRATPLGSPLPLPASCRAIDDRAIRSTSSMDRRDSDGTGADAGAMDTGVAAADRATAGCEAALVWAAALAAVDSVVRSRSADGTCEAAACGCDARGFGCAWTATDAIINAHASAGRTLVEHIVFAPGSEMDTVLDLHATVLRFAGTGVSQLQFDGDCVQRHVRRQSRQ